MGGQHGGPELTGRRPVTVEADLVDGAGHRDRAVRPATVSGTKVVERRPIDGISMLVGAEASRKGPKFETGGFGAVAWAGAGFDAAPVGTGGRGGRP